MRPDARRRALDTESVKEVAMLRKFDQVVTVSGDSDDAGFNACRECALLDEVEQRVGSIRGL
jgi:hypothetical protein